jgi:hypothetical protein
VDYLGDEVNCGPLGFQSIVLSVYLMANKMAENGLCNVVRGGPNWVSFGLCLCFLLNYYYYYLIRISE